MYWHSTCVRFDETAQAGPAIASAELTSGSQSSVGGFRVGNFQAPQEELKTPLREPLLPPIEGLQPIDILHVQVILYKTLIKVAYTACMFNVCVFSRVVVWFWMQCVLSTIPCAKPNPACGLQCQPCPHLGDNAARRFSQDKSSRR